MTQPITSIASTGQFRRTHGQSADGHAGKAGMAFIGIASDASARVLTAAPQAVPQ
jgi:hypothetical protein